MSKTMTAVDDRLYEYIHQFSLREPAPLPSLREETGKLGNISVMQIAPEQGQFMAVLVKATGAQKILEVGTFTGYSALVMALALPSHGKVVACDINGEWTGIAKKYWKEAGVDQKIDLRLAPAAETLEKLLEDRQSGTFDMMFIDADKRNYDVYYELGLQLVRPGGLIMFDNVLWGGAVADPSDNDKDTQAIRALNEKLHRDERVDISLVTVGDGLTLAYKR